jgi:myosin heavy subunit
MYLLTMSTDPIHCIFALDLFGFLLWRIENANIPCRRLHQAAILYNLKLRHVREKPYTRTGDIVIAVNPYQWYHELYTEEKRCYYANRLVWEQAEEDPRAVMEPHVYEVSALAYKGLAIGTGDSDDGECQDQSILVSGESGAGYVD